jgi:hypothetical protein
LESDNNEKLETYYLKGLTMNILETKRIQELLAGLDPATRPYAESLILAMDELGKQSLDAMILMVSQQVSYSQMTMSELTAALKASNDASDVLRVKTAELKQKQALFLQQVVLAIVFAMLGGGEMGTL